MSEGRDRALGFVVGLMAFVAVANLTLDVLSPRTVITQNHYQNDDADRAASKRPPEGFWWWPSPEAWTAFFTCTLFFSTVGLWLATRGTLKHAERTSERELRAYVDVKEAKLDKAEAYPRDDGQTGRALHVTILIENYGKTPALELTTWAHRQYRLASEGEQPPGLPAHFKIAAPRSLAPGATYSHQLIIDITETQYLALDKDRGAATFWVWGEIRYRDAFDEPQEVDFRFFIGGPVVERRTLPYLARAKTGNRAT